MGNETIAYLIKQLLNKVFIIVSAVAFIIMIRLYLFTDYAAVVNDAGIVRGGSQRIVKQVLAGADAAQLIEKNEGILSMPATAKQYSAKQVLDEYFQKRHFKD
jgi:methyl-accepting chemotaxis protein